ncbi:MAG: DUF2232 domain-containing protein [Firmicutes bacterium]|nr:DUF2232 domain-containing protein [Bacillota bacterium]
MRPLATRAVTEGALMAALTVVLVLAAAYVPALGFVLTFFLPAPAAAVTVRHGPAAAFLSVAAAAVLLALFLGPVQALGAVLSFAFLGLAFGFGLRRRWDAGRTILLGALAVAVTAVLAVLFTRLVFHQDILALMRDSLDSTVRRLAASRLPSARATAEMLQAMLKQIREQPLMMIAPAAAAVVAMSAVYYAAMRPLFRRTGVEAPRLTSFAAWTVPRSVAWAWLGVMGLTLLSLRPEWKWLAPLAQNLSYAAVAVFTAVGASVAYFFLRYWGLGVAAAGILAVYASLTPLGQVVVLLGLWDVLAGLRARFLDRLPAGHPLRAEIGEAALERLKGRVPQ